MSDHPTGFLSLFEPAFVEYANADIQGTLEVPPPELVHRVHLIASPEPGVVTVCASAQGWRFLPGGRLEAQETVLDAIARELLEEAGSAPEGRPHFFFSHIATSRRASAYMPHVPYPVAWWTYAVIQSQVVGEPTSPVDGEQITEVHHLPVNDAAAWLAQDETDPTHSAVVRLAAHLKLI